MSMSGRLVVVSAPSGTGKTSLDVKIVRTHTSKVQMVRSCTTRSERSAQSALDNKYRFVSRSQFQKMIDAQEFVEWAEVFGNYYGTSKVDIEHVFAQNKIALLEIDVQGGKQIKMRYPHAVSVFVLPPCVAELHRRLVERDTDDLDMQQRRIGAAYREIEVGRCYDYFIVNDDFDRSYKELESIVLHAKQGKLTRAAGIKVCDVLLSEFASLDLLGTSQRQVK